MGRGRGAVGLTLALTNYAHWAVVTAHNDTVVLGHQNPPVVMLGLAMTIGGIVAYERERRLA